MPVRTNTNISRPVFGLYRHHKHGVLELVDTYDVYPSRATVTDQYGGVSAPGEIYTLVNLLNASVVDTYRVEVVTKMVSVV